MNETLTDVRTPTRHFAERTGRARTRRDAARSRRPGDVARRTASLRGARDDARGRHGAPARTRRPAPAQRNAERPGASPRWSRTFGVLALMRPTARPPGSIEPDALRLVIGLLVACLFVGFAVLLSASVVALTTYLVAVLGSLGSAHRGALVAGSVRRVPTAARGETNREASIVLAHLLRHFPVFSGVQRDRRRATGRARARERRRRVGGRERDWRRPWRLRSARRYRHRWKLGKRWNGGNRRRVGKLPRAARLRMGGSSMGGEPADGGTGNDPGSAGEGGSGPPEPPVVNGCTAYDDRTALGRDANLVVGLRNHSVDRSAACA